MKQKTAISKFSNGRLHLNMQESLTYVYATEAGDYKSKSVSQFLTRENC